MTEAAIIAAFRFGYGPAPGRAAAGTPEELMRGLRDPDDAAARWPGVTGAMAADLTRLHRAAQQASRADDTPANRKEERRLLREMAGMARLGARAAMARATGGHGLRERLSAFWTDHFTVIARGRNRRAWPSALVEDVVRPGLTGRFAAMLTAATIHPAMLLYLDQASSIGPNSRRGKRQGKGLNENFARELLELHTLGADGGYSQQDVRELAELLTGLTYNAETGFGFDVARAEPGTETVLGTEYGGKEMAPVLAVLEDLSTRPETARHLARKLAVHFSSDTPDPALAEALERVWLDSGGDLDAVTHALVGHRAVWEPDTGKVRQPFEFVVAALRALGLSGDEIYALPDEDFDKMLTDGLAPMGQPWQTPGGPDGWPEEAEAWITPSRLAARIEWAMEVPALLRPALPDPRDFARAALGPGASDGLIRAAGAAESLREGIGIVLSAPEFNRR